MSTRRRQKTSDDMSELELQKMTEAIDDVLAEKASKKLRYFFPWAWGFHQGTKLVSNWHIDIIAEHIEAALNREIRRLAVTVSPRSCLAKYTEIRMFDGAVKPIEDIKIGDEVLSFDIITKRPVKGIVDNVLDNKYQETCKLGFYNDDFIIATAEHRFYTSKGYKHVYELDFGDEIAFQNNKVGEAYSPHFHRKIKSKTLYKREHVFDISVYKYDNFTLANGIISHNSKTTISSVSAPAFRWISHPEERFFLSSHKLDLCSDNLIATRNIINYPDYNKRYCDLNSPHYSFRLSDDQSTKRKIANTASGGINISSPDTGIIGSGATAFLIDDIIDETMYKNERIRNERNNWVTDQLFGRSNDVNEDIRIAICQRLGDADLIGHVFEKYKGENGFFELCIPAEYSKRKTYFSPLGQKWNDPRKTEGELMDAKRLPFSYLETISPIRRKTLFNQDPSGSEKGITLNESDIKFVSYKPTSFDAMLIMWDLTFAASEASKSWNVGGVVGRKGEDYYVIDGIRGKLEIMGQLAAVSKLKKKYPKAEMAIEARANGEAVAGYLEREYPGILLFRPTVWGGTTQADKEKRLGAVVPIIKEGHLHFYKPTITDYTLEETYDPEHAKNELVGFPLFSTNDWVDIVSYAVGHLSQKVSNNIIMVMGNDNLKMTEDDYWLEDKRARKYSEQYNETTDFCIFTDNIPSTEDINSINF